MDEQRVFQMAFADVYPHYVKKAERKQRTRAEVDEVICWLTGHTKRSLAQQVEKRVDLRTFFREGPEAAPERDPDLRHDLRRQPGEAARGTTVRWPMQLLVARRVGRCLPKSTIAARGVGPSQARALGCGPIEGRDAVSASKRSRTR